MKKFTVRIQVLAKYMIKNGCTCIGADICERGYLEYYFENNQKTVDTYREARLNVEV